MKITEAVSSRSTEMPDRIVRLKDTAQNTSLTRHSPRTQTTRHLLTQNELPVSPEVPGGLFFVERAANVRKHSVNMDAFVQGKTFR